MEGHKIPVHHKKDQVCATRLQYRQGRKDTAVKVYTIAQESVYVLIHGVPSLKLEQELKNKCEQYGEVLQCRSLDDYPRDQFTDVFLVQYRHLPSAKFMKKKLDDINFYGGSLHVCYAPEFESVQDTRAKFQWRKRQMAVKMNQRKSNILSKGSTTCARSVPTSYMSNSSSSSYIWAGKEYTNPRDGECNDVYSKTSIQEKRPIEQHTRSLFMPRQVIPVVSSSDCKVTSQTWTKSGACSESLQNTFDTNSDDPSSSYNNTIALIRKRMSSSTVSNVEVTLRQRKKYST